MSPHRPEGRAGLSRGTVRRGTGTEEMPSGIVLLLLSVLKSLPDATESIMRLLINGGRLWALTKVGHLHPRHKSHQQDARDSIAGRQINTNKFGFTVLELL